MSARFLPVVLALLGCAGSTLIAQTTAAPGGVAISLSTSARVVNAPDAPPPPPPTALDVTGPVIEPPRIPPVARFSATVSLANHSARPIDFDFPSAAAAQAHFIFRIVDSADKVIWESLALVPTAATATDTPAIYHDTLRARGTWRQAMAIPLVIDGKPLEPGKYVLEVGIDGTPEFGSQASFEVVKAPVIESGVRGVVYAGPLAPVEKPGVPNSGPVAKAIITYANAIAANAAVTTVIADENGRFQFNVPPGSYIVTATIPGDESAPFGHGSQTVQVTANHVSEIKFVLDTGIR